MQGLLRRCWNALIESTSYSFFAGILFAGPKSPSPTNLRPSERWNYMKLVKAIAARLCSVKGARTIFDGEWDPRMAAFLSGITEACFRVSSWSRPSWYRTCAPSASAAVIGHVLRWGVWVGALSNSNSAVGEFSAHAVAVRTAASPLVAFFGVRRASEVTVDLAPS